MDKHDRSFLKNVSLKNPWHFIALGFGSGLLPKAPGTYGSLAALPICMLLVFAPWYIALVVIIFTFILGTIAASICENDLGMHDNSAIVIDEFCGMFNSVFLFPSNIYLTFLAFVLFRFFDVLKPFPINYFDKKIGGGLGVMIDDVFAGLYALAVGHIIIYYFF